MHNSDICGVVVLYYPDDSAVENIITYAKSLDKLYIIDNSDQPSSFTITKFPCKAAALNLALEQASKRFQCLLILLKGWYDYKLNHFGSIDDRK